MSNIDDLRVERERKIEFLQSKGINPYPAQANITHLNSDVINNFSSLIESGELVVVGGRVLAFREHGAIAFIDIFDGTEKIQAFFSKDYMQAAASLGIGLAFDPFNPEQKWNDRPTWQKAVMIIHLALVAAMFGFGVGLNDK